MSRDVISRILNNSSSPRLLKMVQMQGGARWAERGVLRVRRSECPSEPTPQMGLFQQPARPAARAGGRGVTLIETLISSALFAIVIAGVYSVYTAMQGTLLRGEMKADLQQNARIGLGRMVSEIRMAGNDPNNVLFKATPQPRAAIRAASANCLSFIASDETGATKQVTYFLDGTTLKRNEQPWVDLTTGPPPTGTFTGGAGAQPLAESVPSLVFTYYDEYNKVIAPVSWTSTHTCPPDLGVTVASASVQLPYWRMRLVRRIGISLRTQEVRPGVAPDSFTLTTDVRLRNR